MDALLNPSPLRYGAIPFDRVRIEDFLPALDRAIAAAEERLAAWKKEKGTSYAEVLVELEDIQHMVGHVSGVFFNLHSAHCPPEMEKISPEMSARLTKFGNDVTLDPVVFARVKACWETRETQELTPEERTILEKSYKAFTRNGALLDAAGKERLRALDEELAKTSLQFSQNVLKATNEYEMVLTSEEDLVGLPDSLKEAAAETAERKGKKGSWVITLDFPMVGPFMTYSKRRDLRQRLWKASATRAFGGPYDNRGNVLALARLRHERARLLGYATHADYVLEERMASSPSKVREFLGEMLAKARPMAEKEIAKLNALARELDGIDRVERWDSAYYAELLKQREIGLDEESLRPFFKLENVIAGVFEVTRLLYGLRFREVKDLPTYHEDVRVYEVEDTRGHIGVFYMDFHPRETKRAGAWMTSFLEQGLRQGEVRRPHVAIVCNFTKPTKTKPALITLDEVTTLYHEFGHALHGLLSQCRYTTLSGTNVFWDFVELPSQVMENWVYEKECLDLFAAHYENGDKIPAETVQKIKRAANFLEGLGTLRQLSFALLDMSYHSGDPSSITDVEAHEKAATAATDLFPPVPGTNTSCAFSHIFAGGYSAGYYSYKWAEVLDADAFEFFLEKGIFNPEVAARFREHILEKGGTEHPMELYRRFRGKEPSVDALLRRSGLAP